MSFYKFFLKRPVIIVIFLMIVTIGLLIFNVPNLSPKRILNGWELHVIAQKMQRNYFVLQGLLLSKVWEDKFAMYKHKGIAEAFGASAENRKLLIRAEEIAKTDRLDLQAHFKLMTYFYKENNKDVMGFVGYDCGGISYSPKRQAKSQGMETDENQK